MKQEPRHILFHSRENAITAHESKNNHDLYQLDLEKHPLDIFHTWNPQIPEPDRYEYHIKIQRSQGIYCAYVTFDANNTWSQNTSFPWDDVFPRQIAHGGITFVSKNQWDQRVTIGIDFKHIGDYDPHQNYHSGDKHVWTFEQVLHEAYKLTTYAYHTHLFYSSISNVLNKVGTTNQ